MKPDAILGGLKPVQRGMMTAMVKAWAAFAVVVLLCSRRLGKSHLICAYLDYVARHLQGATLVYAAATEAGLRNFAGPIMDEVVRARGGTKPVWKASESMYVYPESGARIILVGCDEQRKVDRHRGLDADVVAVDEAAIIKNLSYCVNSVFLPMLIKNRGRMIVASSGAFTAEDDFAQMCTQADSEGRLIKRTIWDATHLSREAIEDYARQVGGEDTATWKREMLCDFAIEETMAVIPEWEKAKDDVVGDVELPPKWGDRYTVIDGGHVDMCVAMHGYVWWEKGMYVVTDETVNQGATAKHIAQSVQDDIRVISKRVGTPHSQKHRIYGDFPAQTIADLREEGLDISMVAKDDRNASVASLRRAVGYRTLLIHPRCQVIRAHLGGATWAPNGKDFRRVRDPVTGRGHHYDGLDAVRYFVDVADMRHDPYPIIESQAERLGFLPKPASDTRRKAATFFQGPRRIQ